MFHPTLYFWDVLCWCMQLFKILTSVEFQCRIHQISGVYTWKHQNLFLWDERLGYFPLFIFTKKKKASVYVLSYVSLCMLHSLLGVDFYASNCCFVILKYLILLDIIRLSSSVFALIYNPPTLYEIPCMMTCSHHQCLHLCNVLRFLPTWGCKIIFSYDLNYVFLMSGEGRYLFVCLPKALFLLTSVFSILWPDHFARRWENLWKRNSQWINAEEGTIRPAHWDHGERSHTGDFHPAPPSLPT